ncbi:hypothetical protein HCG51_26710 [Tolypothrix sp. PCC 7910]|uniref:hypothetical protein n=1 Tax=Tolypothrix sp. PCC 7910 TaxID=2099387 RepID=UPI001427755B|nr:hypothetical protein [Tolypothrix sp. PCC 7910]QIR39944.1 hypothetical protein HCG51_26710 [Tolypothrix sp. PCC 7910]
MTPRHTSLPLLLTISLATISLIPIQPLQAETITVPQASNAPLELSLLTKPKGSVITGNTINQGNLTVPSLWWAKVSSENKLLDNWIAYPPSQKEAARVDLVVNQQIWSLLDYLERYDFVNRLGTAARKDNYNLRVFNYQEELLATYTCTFNNSQPLCSIKLSSQNQLGWRRSL